MTIFRSPKSLVSMGTLNCIDNLNSHIICNSTITSFLDINLFVFFKKGKSLCANQLKWVSPGFIKQAPSQEFQPRQPVHSLCEHKRCMTKFDFNNHDNNHYNDDDYNNNNYDYY